MGRDRLTPFSPDTVVPNPRRRLSYTLRGMVPKAVMVGVVGIPIIWVAAKFENFWPPTSNFPASGEAHNTIDRLPMKDIQPGSTLELEEGKGVPVWDSKDHSKQAGLTAPYALVMGVLEDGFLKNVQVTRYEIDQETGHLVAQVNKFGSYHWVVGDMAVENLVKGDNYIPVKR